MPENQLELPYVEIKKDDIAREATLRSMFKRSDISAYNIPIEKIKIREGFNQRIVYEGIEELANSIKENGLRDALTVDVLSDGTVYIEKGETVEVYSCEDGSLLESSNN